MLLSSSDWGSAVDEMMAGLGRATGVSRVHLVRIDRRDTEETYCSLIREWTADGVVAVIGTSEETDYQMFRNGYGRWVQVLSRPAPLQGLTKNAPSSEQPDLEIEGIKSFLCVPITVDGDWWGWTAFDDTKIERVWSSAEIDALRVAAGLVGGSIARERADARRDETDRRLRALVEHVPAIFYQEENSAEAYGDILYVSPQVESILGVAQDDWLNARPFPWYEMLHPDDRERVAEEAERVNVEGVPFDVEYRLVTKNRGTVWIHDSSVPQRDAGGEITVWQGVMQDITEQKGSEERLAEAEERLRTLVEQIPAVAYVDALGRPQDAPPVYMSPKSEQVLGYTPDEWYSATDLYERIIHPDDFPRVEAAIERTEQTGERFSVDYRMLSGDGRWLWIHDEAELAHSPDGTPLYWQGVMSDVTEERESRQRLDEAEARFRSLVEQLPAIVYTQDIEGGLTYMSPRVQNITGSTAEEWVGDLSAWRKRLHPADRDRVVALSDEHVRTLEPYSDEYRFLLSDGRAVWIRDQAVVVRDSEGRPLYWQGVMLDITEESEARELQQQLQVERDTSQRLRELDEMKNTFLTAVSHDLRTPLAAILGLALTLEREDLQLDVSETRDLIGRIAGNARRLNTLVADLLDLDRLSRGVVEPNRHPTDVAALVRKVLRDSDLLTDHDVTVDADSCVVSVDGSKVERVVENLLTNAARHTPTGSHVWVSVRPTAGGAEIVVEDDGPGVAPDLRGAIFEPFRQSMTAGGAHSPGVGVGLSLVARFAELHGGRAWVEERAGGGASFHVTLMGEPASVAAAEG
jgi:PAS domain S-box-containing protein